MKWCRFQVGQQVSYGIIEDETVTDLDPTQFRIIVRHNGAV
jgi:Domain of unknown function (DUF2437)